MKANTHYIYGLFSMNDDRCLYVGCTQNPKTRESQHRSNGTGGVPFTLRVLTGETNRTRKASECKIMNEYKAMGQAEFNINGYKGCTNNPDFTCIWITMKTHARLKKAAKKTGVTISEMSDQALIRGLDFFEGKDKRGN